MFFGTFKTFVELTRFPPTLLPEQWVLDNYRTILLRAKFPVAFLNSTVIAVSQTLVTVLTSALGGFVFAKYTFKGKEYLFTLLLATMMVPGAVTLIPLYILIVRLQLNNTLWAILLPGMLSTFGIFLLRQSIEGIPDALIDAARIDGASEWWIFSRVILPLSGAPLGALAVTTFLGSWDSFLWPMVVLIDPDKRTLPLVLAGLRDLYWTRYELWVTGSMLTVAPVMLLYTFARKYFVRGISLSGMKG
jgi:multiple sugar transport system permease protein